ncbi:MAG: hypothetical protein K0S41_4326 [Anaerocolumna sp.]|jgi:hypothetical protein|nr:hypothetical protein [Anaerocolumna sp.]
MKKEKGFIAYSKKLCDYARIECWIITVIYILAKLFLDKDIAEVCLASWGAYGLARSFYYIMARSDHQIQLLQKAKKNGNDKIVEILEDKIESDATETINENLESN